jgi:uncharacterized protein YqjF (DUF2071 family)
MARAPRPVARCPCITGSIGKECVVETPDTANLPLWRWDAIAAASSHRPWPPPRRPWGMHQTWSDLLFAHWTVPAAQLRPRLPPGLELDTFAGDAWIGIIPFRMSNVAPRGLRRGHLLRFPELNVRTYAIADNRPGVWFFSLDAASLLAVIVARTAFHLPYHWAKMTMTSGDGWLHYVSRRIGIGGVGTTFSGQYRPTGPIRRAVPGSLEYWLTERYCLYAVARAGRLLRSEINHDPWPLQPAEAELDAGALAASHALSLSAAPLLHFARRVDMVAWRPERTDAPTS